MEQRILLFLILCMGTRYGLTFLSKTKTHLLPTLGLLALVPAIGFIVIYLFGLRKTGIETNNEIIWWNNLRPLHGLLYGIFAYMALNKNPDAWKILFLDTTIGLIAFLRFHKFIPFS